MAARDGGGARSGGTEAWGRLGRRRLCAAVTAATDWAAPARGGDSGGLGGDGGPSGSCDGGSGGGVGDRCGSGA